MRQLGILAISLFFVCTNLLAQPDSLWSQTYGGSNQDGLRFVDQMDDGGFFLAGYTWSHSTGGGLDFWLVRTDEDGDSLWSRAYGGAENELCFAAQQTSDGGYILAGTTQSYGQGDSDFWLVKIDEDGDTLWTRSFGGIDREECYGVVETTDGGYAAAGFTESYGAGNGDENIWLVKVSSGGDSLWSRSFGGGLNDRCYSLIQTSDGGLALAGITRSFSNNSYDFWLVKTNANGDSLWSHAYGGYGIQECFSVKQTTDGGFIMGGWDYPTDNHNFYLVKTDANGDSLWARSYGGSNLDECYSVIETASGGYALTGITMSYGAGSRDIWLLGVDSSGDSLWNRTFGGDDQDIARCIQQTTDYSYVMAGQTYSFGAGSEDAWLVKTGPDYPPLPPGPFMRVIPEDDSFVNWPLDTFSWTRSVDMNGDTITYLFHVESNMPGYESFDATTQDTILMFDRAQLSNTLDEVFTFHWTVHAAANGDTVEASNDEGTYFYDTPEPPGPFSRVLPWDCTFMDSSFVVFAWTPSIDPNGDEVTYLLSIESPTYPIPDPYEFTTSDTTIAVPIAWDEENLDEIHEFYWRVYATANFDTTEASNGQGIFYVETPEPPGDFDRLEPEDERTLAWTPEHSTIEFIWSRSIDPNGDAVSYIFHVESPTHFGIDPTDAVITDTTITVEIGLPVDPLDDIHTFHWTIYAAANFDTVEATNSEGTFYMDIPGAVYENTLLPTEYSLSVYPNPFNPSTTIHYDIPEQTDIIVTVYDQLGREVARLLNGSVNPGTHSINWNCPSCATGIFLIEMRTKNTHKIVKALLMK